jgi:adenylate kinase family enzyme
MVQRLIRVINMTVLKGKRIVVVGTSGSGKTTLARRLAAKLAVPHIETDALSWGPSWTPVPTKEFLKRLERALGDDKWVIDGNYSQDETFLWSKVTTIVWLDYSLPVTLNRLIRRTTRRIVFQEELWSGNRERLKRTLFTKDSILWWALKSYKRWRQEYTKLLTQPKYVHLEVFRFRSPVVTDRWLESI